MLLFFILIVNFLRKRNTGEIKKRMQSNKVVMSKHRT